MASVLISSVLDSGPSVSAACPVPWADGAQAVAAGVADRGHPVSPASLPPGGRATTAPPERVLRKLRGLPIRLAADHAADAGTGAKIARSRTAQPR